MAGYTKNLQPEEQDMKSANDGTGKGRPAYKNRAMPFPRYVF